jgi:hypothetical protein
MFSLPLSLVTVTCSGHSEIAQPVQVIGFEERQARKPLIFIVLQLRCACIHLFTNASARCRASRRRGSGIRRDMNIIVAVENGLLHMQFIGIGIQQRCRTGEAN